MPFSVASLNLENFGHPKTEYDKLIHSLQVRTLRQIIQRLDADILVLQELIDTDSVDEILPSGVYKAREFSPGPGIHTAVIARKGIKLQNNCCYRKEFTEHWTFDVDKTINIQCSWDRPLLEVEATLPDGTFISIFAIHLKSKRATNVNGLKRNAPEVDLNRDVWASLADHARGNFASTIRRVGQAVELRTILDQRLKADPDVNIIVAGDFNAEEDSVTLETICGSAIAADNWTLREMELIPCELSLPESQRYTYIYYGKKKMLDHILVSRHLLSRFQYMQIFHETLRDEQYPHRNEEYFPDPDHAPLIAYFK